MIQREDLTHVLDRTAQHWEALRGRRLFITGGTGFVGTWLLEGLAFANKALDLGTTAVVLTRDPHRFRARAPHLADDPAIELLEGDFTSFDWPAGEFAYVIHGATADPKDYPAAPGFFGADLRGAEHILRFARHASTRRFLFISSGVVYGPQPSQLERVPEDYPGAPSPCDPSHRGLYGSSKRAVEHLCMLYARDSGFSVTIARLFAFIGAYLPLDLDFAAGNFVRDVLAGGPVRIGGDGTPLRSYLYGADLAAWLWTILIAGEHGRPYNVGGPDAISIRQLAEAVVAATVPGTPIEIAGTPVPGVLPARYVPDVRRAENELGLVAAIPLEDGLNRMYRWYRGVAEIPTV